MASSKYPLNVGHKTIVAGWPNVIPTEEAREFRVREVWNGVWPKIQLAKKIFNLTENNSTYMQTEFNLT